jgi:hypothetical protein
MQRIGEMPLVKRLAKEARAGVITPAQQKLLEAAALNSSRPDDTEAAFMARHLVQCTLPHSNPGKVGAWVRRNGNLALVIQPGWGTEVNGSVGYPYGRDSTSQTERTRVKHRRVFRFRMVPTKLQREGLARMAGARRFVWNRALDQGKQHYLVTGKGLPAAELSRRLTALKQQPELAWLKEADSPGSATNAGGSSARLYELL